MEVIEIAELISAIATFFTVCLAIIELASRRRLKNAEEAIEAYTNYLIAEQQIKYLVSSALTFKEKCDKTNNKECKSYARAHIPDSSLLSLIQSVEKESITTFDSNKDEGKLNSIVVLEAAGAASNVVTAVSTFYQVILDNDTYQEKSVDKAFNIINDLNDKMTSLNLKVEEVLRKNLKNIHKSSNIYIITLVCFSLVFLSICIVLSLL